MGERAKRVWKLTKKKCLTNKYHKDFAGFRTAIDQCLDAFEDRLFIMRIHLVTYATPRFRLRQWVLGVSARLNGVVDTVTSWTPEMLLKAGFEERCKDIKLSERGSGFWAWKPFIIQMKLAEVPAGDLVFYCDVGRSYPFKKLEQPINGLLDWMTRQGQSVMPGVSIPWKGPMSTWTKREAFVAKRMDLAKFHRASPIQASFSLWQADKTSLELVAEWMDLCAQRNLISDDLAPLGLASLTDFHENRHDQSLLSLCCLDRGIPGIDLGTKMPDVDTQHPTEIMRLLNETDVAVGVPGRLLRTLVWPIEWLEQRVRSKVKFGEPRIEPDFINHDPPSAHP